MYRGLGLFSYKYPTYRGLSKMQSGIPFCTYIPVARRVLGLPWTMRHKSKTDDRKSPAGAAHKRHRLTKMCHDESILLKKKKDIFRSSVDNWAI